MCCSPGSQSGRCSKPGASGWRSEAGCAKPRLPLLESLPSSCTGCGSTAPSSIGQRRRSLHNASSSSRLPSGRRRPCRDGGGGEIAPGFAMLQKSNRASHIDPPASSYAIMRRACPYRGENPGPGKDVGRSSKKKCEGRGMIARTHQFAIVLGAIKDEPSGARSARP